ncbi:hypothetical protein [Clostridium oceanicum]|uniref:Uncharacterized protein n=1 Tax=Clostridium oceanicum TaxID=1543 RepID=A0ABN1JE59_9CLOT
MNNKSIHKKSFIRAIFYSVTLIMAMTLACVLSKQKMPNLLILWAGSFAVFYIAYFIKYLIRDKTQKKN